MAKKYTVLETWIVNTTKPVESNSAEQTFDRMERQGGGKLPVIDVPIEYGLEEHFLDEARIRDFAAHMGGAQDILDFGPGDGWPLLRIAPLFKAVTGAEPSQRRVEAITASVEVGKVYEGRVTSVKDFGAFIEILPGKDGLCHISELSDEYVSSVSDVCRVGDRMTVKVISIDDQDRVKLSRRVLMKERAQKEGSGPPRGRN